MRAKGRGDVVAASSQTVSIASRRRRSSRRDARLFFWSISFCWLCLLGWQVSLHLGQVRADYLRLIPWILLIGLVNLLPVSGWHSSALVADFPIGVAAALVLPPVETGLVAFIGAIDPKEFHRCIPPHKALFNRSQVALADFAASLLAHQLIPRVHSLAFVLPIGLVVLATILVMNLSLVG